MIAALLSLTLASCAELPQATEALRRAKDTGELLVSIKTEEQSLGFAA